MNEFITTIADIKAKQYIVERDAFFSEREVMYTENDLFPFRMISFGSTTAISGRKAILNALKEKLDPELEGKELFDAPWLCVIGEVLKPHGLMLSEINDYYVPEESMACCVKEFDGRFSLKRMAKEEILAMKDLKKYDNALCQGEAASINEFAYAAMDRGTIVSIAGISSNSEKIWWVGVDTEKSHRKKGLASALVAKVAAEAIEIGRIPVYVTWYSNIASRKTALRAGFLPGFVEIECEEIS